MDAFQPDVLISEEELAIRIEALGRAITDDFLGEELTVICVLKGAFMFCSDLIKKINLPVKLEFIALSSYGDGMTSTGNVKLEMDLSGSIANKNVLIWLELWKWMAGANNWLLTWRELYVAVIHGYGLNLVPRRKTLTLVSSARASCACFPAGRKKSSQNRTDFFA